MTLRLQKKPSTVSGHLPSLARLPIFKGVFLNSSCAALFRLGFSEQGIYFFQLCL